MKSLWATMRAFAFTFILLSGLIWWLVAKPKAETFLKGLQFGSAVHFTMGEVTEHTLFSQLKDSDEKKIDLDLTKYSMKRLSKAFISADGKFVMTFAKDETTGQIKRVLFVYSAEGHNIKMSDDVLEFKKDSIRTSTGSISALEAL